MANGGGGFLSFFSGGRSEGAPPPQDENNTRVPDEGEDIDIWKRPEPETPAEPTNEPPDIDKALDEYVSNLDFGLKLDPNAIADDFNNGKTDSLQSAINDAARAAYKRAVVDISGSFKQFETRMMDRVKNEINTGINTNQVDMQVRTQFKDIIKDPDIGPVLRSAAQNLQQHGYSTEEIMQQLEKFTGKLGKQFGARGSNNPNRPGPPARGGEDTDWMKFLTED